MTRLLLAAALVAAFFLSPLPTAADARFARLSEPGIVAILRHAFAPGTGDPATFALNDCTTQRNLDAQGRAQARKIGAAIRAAGVTVDRVVTSQWCRCRDTARYAHLARDSIQTTAGRITESIGADIAKRDAAPTTG